MKTRVLSAVSKKGFTLLSSEMIQYLILKEPKMVFLTKCIRITVSVEKKEHHYHVFAALDKKTEI